jgi:hypothetical protein
MTRLLHATLFTLAATNFTANFYAIDCLLRHLQKWAINAVNSQLRRYHVVRSISPHPNDGRPFNRPKGDTLLLFSMALI